jgi:scaffold protein Gp13
MGYVRPYQEGDAAELLPFLRKADYQEIRATTFMCVLDALEQGVEKSAPMCSIIGNTGCVEGLFGIQPEGIFGRVWMVGSDELTKNPLRRQFIRECKTYLDVLSRGYGAIGNVIDERNTVHVRWLRWMGFTFLRRIDNYGVESRPFLEFIKLCAWEQPPQVVDSKVQVEQP